MTAQGSSGEQGTQRAQTLPLIDQRGIPTHECLNCGSNIFNIRAVFEDYTIVTWFLEGTCAECGSPVTVPCPVDDPDNLG